MGEVFALWNDVSSANFILFFLILWSSAKAYLSCKTFYHKVALDVQLMILVLFFFEEKMFCSRDI